MKIGSHEQIRQKKNTMGLFMWINALTVHLLEKVISLLSVLAVETL